MRRLSLTIIFTVISINLFAQSPHGKNFNMDCSNCHNSESWQLIKKDIKFEHDKTSFPLVGQHKTVDCKMCHETLVFTGTKQQCYSCHTDIHKNSVTQDCERCHTPQTWLITNINEVHQHSRFPLLGVHATQDCAQCHLKYSELNFEVLGATCYDCHQKDYLTAKNPDHIASNFSRECQDCHSLASNIWSTTNFSHDFFPLKGGHKISNCFSCHSQGSFAGLSQECYSCHKSSYESTNNPSHVSANMPVNCTQCHTIDGWRPASFDHSTTGFALTGEHNNQSCNNCHSTGYTNTSKECYSCHKSNYDSTTDPNHVTAKFPTTCEQCHTTTAWQPATFDHAATNFPLTGKHAGVDCASCHQNGYEGTSTDCYSCHQTNYNQTNNPNHIAANFPTTCADCHTTSGWTPATFDHDGKYFPVYSGKHKGTWNSCADCHTNQSNFADFSCITCHEHNKQDTDNEHQGVSGYLYQSNDCFACHPTGSKEGSFNHSTTAFPLQGSHTSVPCQSCHQTGYSNTSPECNSCHNSKYTATVNPNHTAVGISLVCENCHNSVAWSPSTFNHSTTAFVLEGKHTTVTCESCHKGQTTGTNQQCESCHQNVYDTSLNPNHKVVGISTECQTCHTPQGWTPSSFNHSNTAFALTGSHLTATCESCHKGKTTGTDPQCYSCHKSNYDSTTDPNHVAANFPTTCEQCHTTSAWKPASFDHATTNFPLSGKHVGVDCASCHQNGYTGTSADCYSCHQTNFNQTTNPNHTAAGFPNTCIDCHTTDGWTPATFDHDGKYFPVYSGNHKGTWNSCTDCHAIQSNFQQFSCITCHEHNKQDTDEEHQGVSGYLYQSNDCYACHPTGSKEGSFNHNTTAFLLQGSHTSVPCQSCHQTGYSSTSPECNSCHHSKYAATVNPNHTAVGISLVCENCHNSFAWSPSTFNHSTTSFALEGKHTTASCESCHKGQTTGTTQQCVGCHQSNYDSSVNPNHKTVGLSTECQTCHTPQGWTPSLFNHSSTAFVLTGKHATASCESCHKGQTTGTTQQCVGCHQSNYDSSVNPNHKTVGIATECQTCHTPQAWSPSSFDHSNTSFVLTGGHITAKCESCHKGQTAGTSHLCYSCHKSNFDSVQDPNHVASNFPTTCEQCHTTTAWKPATFDHALTKFPLIGKHTTVNCAQCHTSGYTNTPTDCYSCHSADYNKTTNPNHVSSKFPTTCNDCHDTNGWSPATFNHSLTKFPLTGKHTSVSCTQCHTTGYTGTPTDCYACHASSYNNTTNPNHTAAHFPTTCNDCHTTSGWTPASFDHDGQYFPIYSGKHRGVWNTCAECHTVTNNYASFSCIDCHEHSNKASVDREHREVSNYVYQSSYCYQCHPTGRSGD